MRKNFSPAVWHRQENVFATSCSFLFSSLPVFLVFSWVTKIETKVERREEEEEEECVFSWVVRLLVRNHRNVCVAQQLL